MKFAIIAAGEGSRLAEEGITAPKPLISLNGVPMIERLVRIFAANDAEEIVIIVNHLRPETEKFVRHLGQTHPEWNIRLEVATTPSSMHSFARIAPLLAGAPLLFDDGRHHLSRSRFPQLHRRLPFCPRNRARRPDGGDRFHRRRESALHRHGRSPAHRRLLRHARATFPLHLGGIYALAPRALDTLRRCMAEGQSRMRNFQRGLIADGLKLKAYPFSKILDVDHAADIPKAEAFLRDC